MSAKQNDIPVAVLSCWTGCVDLVGLAACKAGFLVLGVAGVALDCGGTMVVCEDMWVLCLIVAFMGTGIGEKDTWAAEDDGLLSEDFKAFSLFC